MLQLARPKQRRVEPVRTPAVAHAPAIAVGKRSLTAQLEAKHLGAPDYYTRAIESALRELRAVRVSALPAYIAVLRKRDVARLPKQVDLARAAMQVRHLLMCANQHVYALESAATYADPMVRWLRADLDVLVARATRLGVYRDAEDMIPRRYVEDKAKPGAAATQTVPAKTAHVPADTRSSLAAAKPAQITRSARTRLARGTAPVATQTRPAPVVRGVVQRKASGDAARGDVRRIAAHGVVAAAAPLPFASEIQRAFGRHDISGIRVQIGGAAAGASRALGARAYATGHAIAFASAPDLHTAAHEAAHVIQQRAGLSLVEGLDGGASDAYEQHADRVADAVVAGRSAQPLLDELRGGGVAEPAVQRKLGPDSAYTVQRNTKERRLPGLTAALAEVGADARWKAQWQATVKNGGAFGGKRKNSLAENETRLLSTQAALERAEGKFEAKLQTELVKNVAKLLEGQPFDLGIPVTVQLETKALDASLSTRKLDFKLASVSIGLEGDFTSWMGTDHFEVKGAVTVDVSLGAKLAKHIVELAQAGHDVEKVARYEAKVASTQRRLATLKAMTHCKATACALDHLREQRKLERELAELRGMRGKLDGIRRAATDKIKRVGKRLESTAGGKLIKKLGAKALGKAFKKLIPIYNVISTVQDVYAVGEYLANLDWSSIGDRIMNGGQGGAELGDASNDESGTGGDGEGGLSEIERDDVSTYAHVIASKQNVQLHQAAEVVMASLALPSGAAVTDGNTLSADEKDLINMIVPEDLTSEELAQAAGIVAAQGATARDRVESVIAAIQIVRPNGERTPTQGPDQAAPPSPSQSTPAKQPARRAKREQRRRARRIESVPDSAGASRVVDLEDALRSVVSADIHFRVTAPQRIELPGFEADVIRAFAGFWAGGTGHEDAPQMTVITLKLAVRRAEGRYRNGRAPVVQGGELSVVLQSMPATSPVEGGAR